MNVLLCYFSATGNTLNIGKEIAAGMEQNGAKVEMKDITPLATRDKGIDYSQYDAVVFGTPIHAMRAPAPIRQWLKTQDGGGIKCAMYLTYGGFQIHPAHYSLQGILLDANFKVLASADFPGKHSFNLYGWDALGDRPDESDLALATRYGTIIADRFSGKDNGVLERLEPGPLTDEQLDKNRGVVFKFTPPPSRRGEECQMCYLCQEQCPTGAMDAEKGEATQEKCILCMGCVANCPDEALKLNDMSELFKIKMEMDKETPATLKAKTGTLYL